MMALMENENMASFTGVGDNVELFVPQRGDTVDIDISGTYNMTIDFQKEQGGKGSGSWVTLRTYTTANATVAETYVTESFNENLRLIVKVDTSGTATATLADNTNIDVLVFKDDVGNTLFTQTQGGIDFAGTVDVTGAVTFDSTLDVAGVFAARSVDVVTIADATNTLTLASATHAGRLLYVLDATLAVTMPEATGSGDVYTVVQGIAATGSTFTSADTTNAGFVGSIVGSDTDVDAPYVWRSAAVTNDVITFNGTSTGGKLGDWVKFIDVATDTWLVTGNISQSGGSEATPFSST